MGAFAREFQVTVCGVKVCPVSRLRAACLQNETAPEKLVNRYEKRFEKRVERSEKRSETRPKNV